jgi:hypothetical protein
VDWQFFEYGQYSRETCSVRHLQKEIIRHETTWGSQSTISPNIEEW